MSGQREVSRIVTAHRQREGAGFIVRRPFPTQGLELVDPFLLLDEMGPADYAPGEAVGAPDHPHRGFETVTYMLAGEFEHEDSAGHRGLLRAGDVQWMTAGAGIVHSEMPSAQHPRGRRAGARVPDLGQPARALEDDPASLPGGSRREHTGGAQPGRPGPGPGDRRRGAGGAGGDRHAHPDRLPGLDAPARART